MSEKKTPKFHFGVFFLTEIQMINIEKYFSKKVILLLHNRKLNIRFVSDYDVEV